MAMAVTPAAAARRDRAAAARSATANVLTRTPHPPSAPSPLNEGRRATDGHLSRVHRFVAPLPAAASPRRGEGGAKRRVRGRATSEDRPKGLNVSVFFAPAGAARR